MNGGNHNVVVVCCAWSFTLCLLAFIALLWNYYQKSQSLVVFLQCLVSAIVGAIMVVIILAVTESAPKVRLVEYFLSVKIDRPNGDITNDDFVFSIHTLQS